MKQEVHLHFTRLREVLKAKEYEVSHSLDEVIRESLVKLERAYGEAKVMKDVALRGKAHLTHKIMSKVNAGLEVKIRAAIDKEAIDKAV
jgi:hypothetical protein